MKPQWLELTCEIELGEGETLSLPEPMTRSLGPGRWIISIQPADQARQMPVIRNHSAFLNSYSPEDEGLYDHAERR